MNQYGVKPYSRVDAYCFGMLAAILFENVIWFQFEASQEERDELPRLQWLNNSTFTPLYLWTTAFITFILYTLQFFFIDIYNVSGNGYLEINQTKMGTILIMNTVFLCVSKMLFLGGFFCLVSYFFIFKGYLF